MAISIQIAGNQFRVGLDKRREKRIVRKLRRGGRPSCFISKEDMKKAERENKCLEEKKQKQ